jgi:hypothetical protein
MTNDEINPNAQMTKRLALMVVIRISLFIRHLRVVVGGARA